MVIVPSLRTADDENGADPTADPAVDHRGVLVWRFDTPRAVLSSAAVGGGRTEVSWVMNLGVTSDYARTDLDVHASELAGRLGLVGAGSTLFTAADVTRGRRCEIGGVAVDATVGVTKPTWAADPDWTEGTAWRAATTVGTLPGRPGTINLVVQFPLPLDEGAAVNAVITATEAKTQALIGHGIAGTGTASDAVVVVWPQAAAVSSGSVSSGSLSSEPGSSDAETARFAGPRSPWGARLALAVHGAVRAGLEPAR